MTMNYKPKEIQRVQLSWLYFKKYMRAYASNTLVKLVFNAILPATVNGAITLNDALNQNLDG